MKTLLILSLILGLSSLSIAVYQFIDGRPYAALLSVVFTMVFLGAAYMQNKRLKSQEE